MTRRERLLSAIAHQETDRVPIGFDIFEPLKSQVLAYYGVKELWQLHDKVGIDAFSVWDWPSVQPRYIGQPRDGVTSFDTSNAYGCWGKVGELIYPLANTTLDEYRWPSADDFDYSLLKEDLQRVRDMDMTSVSGHAGVGWLHHVQMRSYDQVFYDILDDEWMEEYIDKNRKFFLGYFKKLFETAGGLIDIIRADEDLGGQSSMLISPDLWRRWYKPLWCEVFALCKENGARIWLHSCGYCRPLIEDFIEIGVDILNPIPPYVKDSDPGDMKITFGSRLTFDGGVDQMNVLSQGTPEQVVTETQLRLKQLMPGGGCIIGPSQVLTGDVPLKNAVAFFDTVLEYGRYESKISI